MLFSDDVTLPRISNREDLYLLIGIYDDDTGDPLDLSGMTFQFEIRRQQPRNVVDGYVSWWGIGTTADYGPLIVAGLGTGITVIDIGIIQIEILETQIRQLCTPNFGNSFGVGLTMTDGHSTRQIFTGSLPVTYGGVTN